jgi:hypothetical protein
LVPAHWYGRRSTRLNLQKVDVINDEIDRNKLN